MNPDIDTLYLQLLHAAGQVGMTEDQLTTQARIHADKGVTVPMTSATLRGLADKSLVISWLPPVGPRRWRITAQGTSALEESGLA